MPIGVKVIQGRVIVDSVTVLHESERCVVLAIDCKTKWPNVVGFAEDAFVLVPSERSTNVAEAQHETEVHLSGLPEPGDDTFIAFGEAVRYTVYVTAIIESWKTDPIWSRNG